MSVAADSPVTQRSLGLPELIAMGVGGMIGGGIFSVLGMAVEIAGPAAPLAFVVGALVALAAGYSYVKLALAFHSDGASFTYLEHAFPAWPHVAGIAGWTVIVGYVGTLALYAYTFGAYAAHLLGDPSNALLRMALSACVLLVFMAVNLVGARVTGRAEDIIVYTKIILLTIFAVAGVTTVQPERVVAMGSGSITSVLVAGAVLFVAFEGFQLITNSVTETREPERSVPRGIYGSIVITSVIYLGVAVVAVGSLGTSGLMAANEYALAVAAEPALGRAGTILIDIAALLATSSAINATAFGASRMLAEMAQQGRVPRAFTFRSRARVPWVAIVVLTGGALAFAMTSSLEIIATFSSLTFLLVSIGVSLANLRLRRETASSPYVVVAGLGLMGAATVLLLVHLYERSPSELAFTVGIFAAVAVLELAFAWLHKRKDDA